MEKDFIIKCFNDLKPSYESLPRKVLYNRNIGLSIDIDTIRSWNNVTKIERNLFYPMKRVESNFKINNESSIILKLINCLEDIKYQEEKLFLDSIDNIAEVIETNNLLNGMNKAISMFDTKFKPNIIIGKNITYLENILIGYKLINYTNIPEHTYYLMSDSPQAAEFVVSQDLELSFINDNSCLLKEWTCSEIHPFKTIMKINTVLL